MSNTTNQDQQTAHRPVTKNYLRFLLETLNEEDSGPGKFAQLAGRLIHRRKCPNIVPATEPSAGGDYGQDARSQRVLLDSEGLFRLYASPPAVSERWIFAFSITKEWKAKLASDAAKIVANHLRPGAIIYVTNQFIHPERVKIDAELEIERTYGVPCEILDGQWILNQLYEQDYHLAVEFLGCAPEADPNLMDIFRRLSGLQEGGLSEEEAIELEQLKGQVQYRNRYTDTPEHLIQDLRRIGTILARYEPFVAEAIAWYEEALPALDSLTQLVEGIELLHAYFQALQKRPDGASRIFSWLPRFIDLVFATEARSLYHYIREWLQRLVPRLKGQAPFDALYRDTLARFRAIDRSRLTQLSLAHLDETILLLEFFLVYQQKERLHEWLQRLHAFLQSVRTVGAYPRGHIAGVLGSLAPVLNGFPEYEACFALAMELRSDQEGAFAKATMLKERTLAHARANQLSDAIVVASRAKKLWFHECSIRGYLLMTYSLARWYSQLDFTQAAEYELLEGAYIATWQPVYMEPDLLAAMIVALAGLALQQGRVLRGYRWLLYYEPICHMHRLQPDSKIATQYLENDLNVLAMWLYAHNRSVHDRLLEIGARFDPNILLTHREINLSSDEEFEDWLSDLPEDLQTEMRNVRRRVHAGEKPIDEDWVEYDELAEVQYLEWKMAVPYQGALTLRLSYPHDTGLAQIAFTLAAATQIWLVFLHREIAQLTLADDRVHITLEWLTQNDEPLTVTIEHRRDEVHIALAMTHQYARQVAGLTSNSTVDLFIKVVGSILMEISLDHPDEIAALFHADTHGESLERLFDVAPPACLWEAALAQAVMGVDDAT